jgi:hypothetical protein
MTKAELIAELAAVVAALQAKVEAELLGRPRTAAAYETRGLRDTAA